MRNRKCCRPCKPCRHFLLTTIILHSLIDFVLLTLCILDRSNGKIDLKVMLVQFVWLLSMARTLQSMNQNHLTSVGIRTNTKVLDSHMNLLFVFKLGILFGLMAHFLQAGTIWTSFITIFAGNLRNGKWLKPITGTVETLQSASHALSLVSRACSIVQNQMPERLENVSMAVSRILAVLIKCGDTLFLSTAWPFVLARSLRSFRFMLTQLGMFRMVSILFLVLSILCVFQRKVCMPTKSLLLGLSFQSRKVLLLHRC